MEHSESRKDFVRHSRTTQSAPIDKDTLQSVYDEGVELDILLGELDDLLESDGGILTP